MEKEVKSEYDETEVKQEMDIKSECVENVYTVSERNEHVSLFIHPMQTNTPNTSQTEDYFFEDIVKSGRDESERKQEVSSIDFSEYTEDKYSVVEPAGKPVLLDVGPVQIHIKDTSLAEDYFVKELVKSEDNVTEHKQEAASSAVRSIYTEDSVRQPTNELTSLVDPFSSTFQINTQHPDWSEDYVIKDEVKSEYDETEFKQENSSIDLEPEVFTEDKNALIEATSDPLSLVMDSVQINTQNIDTSEENIFEPLVKIQYDEIDHKQEVSSIDFKLEYSEDKYTIADPISLADKTSTCQINTQNADPSEDNNSVKVAYAIQRLDKPVSREISEMTSRRRNLEPHQLTHTGDKFFSCDVCSKAFSRKGDLKRYVITQRGERDLSCDVCSMASSLESDLRSHIGENFFSCDICSKTFSRRENLKVHLRTHTGEKLFSCDVCSKSFSQKCHLQRHQFTHTEEKFFSCDVCSKSFSLRSDLKRHMFTHTGDKFFSCDICSKSFSQKCHLKTHQLTHTEEKFFSCDVCSKAFSRRSGLKRHMFTHKGDKFFSCDICSKSFSQKSHLKTHIHTHGPTGDG